MTSGDSGGRRLSAFLRVVKFAKITALLSAVWTILCAAIIVGLQVTSLIRNGVWDAYQLSSIIKSLKSGQNITYVTASSDRFAMDLTIKQVMADWFLEIPAIVPLLIVAALLLGFYLRLAVIEKEASGKN
jgi:hypothetical protein